MNNDLRLQNENEFDLRSPSLWFEHSRFRNLLTMTLVQARSQKFAMGGLFGGSGGGAPSARKFCIFLQK